MKRAINNNNFFDDDENIEYEKQQTKILQRYDIRCDTKSITQISNQMIS